MYQRLSQPFPSKESADDSLNNFYTEFRELREKYGIPDVVLIVRSIYMEGEEQQDALLTMHCGDGNLMFPMVMTTYQDEKEKFLKSAGMVVFPRSLMNQDKFFTAFLLYAKIVQTIEDAQTIVENGGVKINNKVISVDGPALEDNFLLTVGGESFQIPGRKGYR